MNNMANLNDVIARGEGILSITLAPNGVRDNHESHELIENLVDCGMNQFMSLCFEPNSLKMADIAPAERMMLMRGIEKGFYANMFFDFVREVRANYKDLPIVATPHLSEVLCFGKRHFLEMCLEAEVDAVDSAFYDAVKDPAVYRRDAEKSGIKFINAIFSPMLDFDDPEDLAVVEGLVRTTSGELFFVPGNPGEGKKLDCETFKSRVDLVREMQKKHDNICPIVGIGGINTAEDAHGLVHTAGVDGVHFSSAFMKRLIANQPRAEIWAWLKEVRNSMKR